MRLRSPVLTCECLETNLGNRYAYFKKLDYFSTECIYSPDAYRGHARVFLKDLEAARPSAIIDIIHSGEAFEVREEVKATQRVQRPYFSDHIFLSCDDDAFSSETCQRCGYMSSNELCKACTLLEGLERGMANSGIVCSISSCFVLYLERIWSDRSSSEKAGCGGACP